jgi:putative hydrolase of the HAD superfamily
MNPAIAAVLFDLDGVIRHFDPAYRAAIEAEHGLEPGSLNRVGFEPELIERLITGVITRAEWVAEVGRRVGSPEAGTAWQADIGTVDQTMMAQVDLLRAAGLVVAILTNGTDTIPAEMATLGLADRFDHIFNTAEIGASKKVQRPFRYVCRHLGLQPNQIFFTDDSPSNVTVAQSVGMVARRFEDCDRFKLHLQELGIG